MIRGKTSNKSIENIIFFFFLLLPIADSINGFLVRTKGYYGVGSFYHLLLIIIVFCFAYLKPKIRFGFYEKSIFIMIVDIVLSILINYLVNGRIESITIERIEKIMCTVFSIACINTLIDRNCISMDGFKKILDSQLVMVPIITLLADFGGIGNYTYQAAKVGRLGFYTGSNEPIIVFAMFSCVTLSVLIQSFSIKYLMIFFADLMCLIFAQSKMSYAMAVLIGLVALFYCFNRTIKKHKVKAKFLKISIPIIIGAVIIGINTLAKTIGDFIAKQEYQSKYLLQEGWFAFISSGRTLRFESLLSPVLEGNPVWVLFKVFFGQGAGFAYSELFEMDYFDVFLYGGVVLLGVFIAISLRIVTQAYKYSKEKFNLFAVLLVLSYGFFAGHLWSGGVSGLYFALFIIYFTKMTKISFH